jgi:type IV pilus assembly protein PilA
MDAFTILGAVFFVVIITAFVLMLLDKLIRKLFKKETKLTKWEIALCFAVPFVVLLVSAIYLPSYGDYSHRALTSEGLSLASGAKIAVAEFYQSEKKFPSSNAETGLASPEQITGNAVRSIAVSEGGIITIVYNEKMGDDGYTLILKAIVTDDSITWDCLSGTLPYKYRTANCRN